MMDPETSNYSSDSRSSQDEKLDSEKTPLISSSESSAVNKPVRAYRWRWVVLSVYVLIIATTNMQWITFGPVANVISCYYGVSDFWVNSLSMVYMVTYTFLMLLGAWSLKSLGLRSSAIIASCFNAAGACLRLAGVAPNLFWLLLLGQTFSSITQVFIWGAPSLLSSMWFPPSERATATAAGGAIGPQVGVLVGFVLTPLIVRSKDTNRVCSSASPDNNVTEVSSDLSHAWSNTIYYQLFYWLLVQAVICLVLMVVTLIAFRSAPPTPPSISRQLVESTSNRQDSFWASLKMLLKNGYFLLYVISAGLSIGVSGVVQTVLNEIVHPYFPNNDEDIAYIGLTAQLSGIVTMLAVGRLLDWTKAFYIINLATYVVTLLALAALMAVIQFQDHFVALYVPAGFLGAAVSGFQAVAYEYAVEMTYPLPEGTSAGLINWISQPLSIVMIVVFGQMAKSSRVSIGNWFITGVTVFGTILTVFIRPKLRRLKLDSPSVLHIKEQPASIQKDA